MKSDEYKRFIQQIKIELGSLKSEQEFKDQKISVMQKHFQKLATLPSMNLESSYKIFSDQTSLIFDIGNKRVKEE